MSEQDEYTDEQNEYIESLQNSMLARFGYMYGDEEAMEWFEVDATVDQALEWINHGAGPGDYAGCRDPENAWTDV